MNAIMSADACLLHLHPNATSVLYTRAVYQWILHAQNVMQNVMQAELLVTCKTTHTWWGVTIHRKESRV